ncbi:hypothetical protein CAEBREN_14953 [Caenorhabditis brenneri]|uniref:Uncharacterized protein n=1 Tax=Caenorhabditis brenneri TaxID=135651 RepID=G0NXM6_CAEBE|nr:hypothetical protein CAEBREN_14953 [Caenorhabditis brenneri]
MSRRKKESMRRENPEFQRHAAWNPYQQGPIQHPQHQMQDQYHRWPTYQQQAHQNQYQHQMYHQQVEQERYRQLQMQHHKRVETIVLITAQFALYFGVHMDLICINVIWYADPHRSHRLLLLVISSQPKLPLPEKSEMLTKFREIMAKLPDDKKEMVKIVLDGMLRGMEGFESNGIQTHRDLLFF